MFTKNILNQSIQFLVLAGGFFILSCENLAESQQVNETSKIKPIISLTGSLNHQTKTYKSKISVLLKNGSNNAIEINGGMVQVNGFTMTPPNTALLSSNKHNDYVFYGDIIPDELYVIEVTLSNSQTYRAWIESPEVFPTTLDIPQRIERDKDVVIKWQKTDYRYPQILFLQNYVTDIGFTKDNQDILEINTPFYGSYIIDKKYIAYQNISDEVVNEIRIILESQTEGSLDPFFSQNGTIKCTFQLFTDVEIY